MTNYKTIEITSILALNNAKEQRAEVSISQKKKQPFSKGRGGTGGNKRKSRHDDEHGHGQKKRRPSIYVEGEIMQNRNKC